MRVTVLRGVFISSFGTFCVNVAGGPAGGWLLIIKGQTQGFKRCDSFRRRQAHATRWRGSHIFARYSMESSGSGSSLSLKVAGQILRSDLGELVETVGVHLLEHGPCTLIQLASGLESTGSTLTATQIRASLLVLFQHNIASVAAPAAPPPAAPAQRGRAAAARPAAGNGSAAGSVSAAGKRPVYHASLDEVLARRWYPWVVCATRRRIGDDAAALLVEVLAVGRCTLDSPYLPMSPHVSPHLRRCLLSAGAPSTRSRGGSRRREGRGARRSRRR